MKTGAAYIRVSTEDQTEYSPDSQLKKIREYASCHHILLPDDFLFLDEGISGRSARKRPAFMKMIGMAKQKPRPFDLILVWKFSRFARSRQDSILYKSMLRKDCGIDVISITEHLSDDPTAILIEALLEAMDEYYSINLAQEVRRGMNEKFSRGGVVSVPPFGYRMGAEHFVPDPEKAPFVPMIFRNFLNGMSFRQIAVRLNELGVRTVRGSLFESRSVEYILTNPTYLGKLRRSAEGDEAPMRIVRGHHTPLVDEEIFSMVQRRISESKKALSVNAKNTSNPYMLQGLIRCSNCGSFLTPAEKGKSLQCPRYAKGLCVKSHHIRLNRLNQAVLEGLKTDLHKGILDIRINRNCNSAASHTLPRLLYQQNLRMKRIKTAYETGIDSLEEYRQNKAEITKQISGLQEAIRLQTSDRSYTANHLQINLLHLLSLLEQEGIKETAKNEILKAFVSYITFYRPEDAIQIHYRV